MHVTRACIASLREGITHSGHKQTDDDWTISYAVAGVVPRLSSVITLFIIYSVFSPHLMESR